MIYERGSMVPNEQLTKNLLEHLFEGCQIISHDYRYLYVNEVAARHGHTTPEALTGRKMSDAYPGIEQTDMFVVLRRCMETRTHERLENEFTYPDGKRGWFELRFQPVPEGLAVLSADITAQKRALEVLRDSEAQLRTIFELASVGIFQINPQTGRLLRWNKKFQDMIGYTKDELSALDFASLTHPEERETDRLAFKEAINQNALYQTQRRYLRKDGVELWVHLNASFVRDSAGVVQRTIIICEDITQQKKNEEAARAAEFERMVRLIAESNYERLQQLEQMRDGLVHMVVHDTRTLCTSLIFSLSVLQAETSDILNEHNAEDLARALDSSQRLAQMMNDLVDVSKMESGQMPLTRKRNNLSDLIQVAIQNTNTKEGKIRCSSLEPVWVHCDDNLILRVLENLLNNSLRHAPKSESIDISLELSEGYANVSIKDDGPGIDQQYHQKIFEKFGALQIPKTNRRVSTGLGLAFCKLAVEAHGGKIKVESAESKGCTFRFSIPNSA
jgi:PAS domain S-box-containing protein